MIFMPSNHSGAEVHYLAGRFPGKVGWLIGPSAIRKQNSDIGYRTLAIMMRFHLGRPIVNGMKLSGLQCLIGLECVNSNQCGR